MFDIAKFGAFVAKLRKRADMTQSELADRLNLTRQAISRYECGDSFPDISVLKQLSEIFGVSVESLISAGDPTKGEAEIIEAVAANRDIIPTDAKDVVSLAPLLKPSVLKNLSENMARQGLDMSSVLSLAEYLNETDTKELMDKVDFDSLAEMDLNLLEKLLPLLGPYAPDVIFQKIIDGELDYHYLELLGDYSYSSIEAAVVFGVIDADALNIMRRNNYNRARMKRAGVIKLFTCPKCAEPLLHFHPRRCKCGSQPPVIDNILRLAAPKASSALTCEKISFDYIRRRFGNGLLVLVLGAASLDAVIDFYYDGEVGSREFVVLDDDLDRLSAAEREIHSKNCAQLLFALDELRAPHLVPGNFDLVIDNTADRIGESDAITSLLKPGGCVIRGEAIVCER